MNTRERQTQRSGEWHGLDNKRLGWLIVGRMCIAGVLLGVGAVWTRAWLNTGVERTAMGGALPLAMAVVVLSLVYVLALRFSSLSLATQAAVQFAFDVLLVTWLVWATGDLHSPYAALYIVVISVVSIFLGARGALFAAVGCGVCYTAVMLSLVSGLFGDGRGEAMSAPLADAVTAIGLNNIGFFVVGLLAARLAERQTRSDVQLKEATHALADLRALHERIVESIRSGVVTTDLERRIYTLNPAAEEMTGYTAADLRGQDVSILFGDITRQIADSMNAVSRGEPGSRYEAECLTADGFRMRLGYSISPLSSERGETTGLVITCQDLTDIRAMEETARRQDRLAAVGRFTARIAHEIRNPLAAMRGSIQVLKSEMPADSAQAELMEIVLRESDRLNRIITDILNFARPRQMSFAEVDVREPLRETFTLLRNSPELRDGHLLEEHLPDEPVDAMADAEALKQVFWNLARNALTAMPEGGRLSTVLQKVEGKRVRIIFEDTGRGMTPAQVERLFEPFAVSTTGGTGLGLSIVYQIIREHNGTINVRSREGHGTVITIELPGGSQEIKNGTGEHRSGQKSLL